MSDTDQMRREANSKADQRSQAEQDQRSVEANIERLRVAERQLTTEKTILQGLKDGIQSHEDPGEAWAGQRRNQYHDYVKNDVSRYYTSYIDGTDAMLDAVVRRIAELENQSSDLDGFIGWLSRAINSLWADIRSATN